MAEQREPWTPTSGDAEAALVRRSRGGDLEAFGALVRRHEGTVRELIGQILGTDTSSVDVQETATAVFARAWRDLPGLRDETRFPLWLSRRAVWVALRRSLPAKPEAVDALPRQMRAVLRLHYTGGHPLERVAHLLGRPMGEIRALLLDGCRRLSPEEDRPRDHSGGQGGMYRTWLIPALEDILDQAQRAELAARMADDPALASELSALRRALPPLRAALLRPHTPPVAAEAAPAPLWPRLRDRLAETRPRPAPPRPAGWVAGLGLLGLLLASSLSERHWSQHRDRLLGARLRRELRHAPLVVFHRDNALGTRTASRLRARVRRVSRERRAIMQNVAPRPPSLPK